MVLKWCPYCRFRRNPAEFEGHAIHKDGIPTACARCREQHPELAEVQVRTLKRWHKAMAGTGWKVR
jgi:hypothetical protein